MPLSRFYMDWDGREPAADFLSTLDEDITIKIMQEIEAQAILLGDYGLDPHFIFGSKNNLGGALWRFSAPTRHVIFIAMKNGWIYVLHICSKKDEKNGEQIARRRLEDLYDA